MFQGSRAGGENSHPVRGMHQARFTGNATMAVLVEAGRTASGFFAIGQVFPTLPEVPVKGGVRVRKKTVAGKDLMGYSIGIIVSLNTLSL